MAAELNMNIYRNGLSFFKRFINNPSLVGSVVPSSRFLERRLVRVGKVAKARLVVELGPGTGGTTKAVLAALPKNAVLLAIELNPEFASLLKSENDPRLIVHNGSAEDIGEILKIHGLSKPDVVLSGIPFSTMPEELGRKIIKQVWTSLSPRGRFVAYQVRDKVARLGQELIGVPETEIEFVNVPPVRVYSWDKSKKIT